MFLHNYVKMCVYLLGALKSSLLAKLQTSILRS